MTSITTILFRATTLTATLAGAFMLVAASCDDGGIGKTAADSSGGSNALENDAPFARNLTVAQTDSLITANRDNASFFILDVRTREEFDAGHIAGAIRYDYNAGELQDAIDTLDKNDTYLIYCRSGNRSARAMAEMRDAGFTALYNMLGGMNDWAQAGLPVSK